MDWARYIDDKPSAWRGHIQTGYDLVKTRKPRVIVELGVMFGHSFFTFAQAVKDQGIGSILYGVDNWVGDAHVGQYGDEVFNLVEQTAKEAYGDLDIRLIRGDFEEAAGKIRHKIDFLHIDGSHDYESVSKDWQTYSKKLREGAMVLFHDIDVEGFGVRRLYEEIKQAHPEWEYTDHEGSYGLGVINMSKAAKDGQES